MYKVKNRSGQVLNIYVVKGGNLTNEFVISGGSVESEEITDNINRLKDQRAVRVREVEESIQVQEEEDNNESEEVVKLCEAKTQDGDSCSNEAKYPEDEPKYCGVHKDLLEDENENDEILEEK